MDDISQHGHPNSTIVTPVTQGLTLHPLATTSIATQSSRLSDEQDLISYCQAEAAAAKRRKTLKPLAVVEELDKRIAEVEEKEHEGFVCTLGRKLKQYQVHLPTVTIEYEHLSIKTDALLGSAAIATVGGVFFSAAKRLVGLKPPTKELTILNNLSGVIKPGRATLLLGPPSSGRSSFLKVLSGRYRDSKNLRVTGSLKYNGHTQDEFVVERTTALVPQLDNHIACLSVQETLKFAYICQCGYSYQGFDAPTELKHAMESFRLQHPDGPASPHVPAAAERHESVVSDDEVAKLYDEVYLTNIRMAMVMRTLGIMHTKDTPIGDAMLRGVSGGERKRVTMAEMLVGPRRVLLLDEVSNGLDSATLHSIMKHACQGTRMLDWTMVANLLQPPPEVYELFDDVILMTEGNIVYHGPVGEAVAFFERLGFVCPPRKDVPSFLQEVTTPSGQHEYASEELRQRTRARVAAALVADDDDGDSFTLPWLVTIEEMVEAFWSAGSGGPGQRMAKALAHPYDRSRSHPAALVKTRYALTPLQAILLVTKHQLLVAAKDKIMAKARLVQVVVMGLIAGSLFYQLDVSLLNSRSFFSAAFLGVMFMAMGQMPVLPITMGTKSIWLKHRDNYFYPSYAHAIGCTLAAIPMIILDSLLYSIILYFMVGFYSGAQYFFTWWCVMMVFSITVNCLFRLVAHVSPTVVVSHAYGGLLLVSLILLSGYSIVRGSIPDYWIWAYYISPFAWSLRALVVNEFTSPRWSMPSTTTPGMTLGEEALRSFDFYTERKWIWSGVAYDAGLTMVLVGLSALALAYLNGERTIAHVADPGEIKRARREAQERRKAMLRSKSMAAEAAAAAAAAAKRSSAGASAITNAFPNAATPYSTSHGTGIVGTSPAQVQLSANALTAAVSSDSHSATTSPTDPSAPTARSSSDNGPQKGLAAPAWLREHQDVADSAIDIAGGLPGQLNGRDGHNHKGGFDRRRGDSAAGDNSSSGSSSGAGSGEVSPSNGSSACADASYPNGHSVVAAAHGGDGACGTRTPLQPPASVPDSSSSGVIQPVSARVVSFAEQCIQVASPMLVVSPMSGSSSALAATHGGGGDKVLQAGGVNGSNPPSSPAAGAKQLEVSVSANIPFTPVTLVFENIRYFVPNPAAKTKPRKGEEPPPAQLELLKGLTGYAEPGVLTALMGGSGAGKTTMMDVIAGRKTIGHISGDIWVNGHPKDQRSWSRVMGYVEQMDIHTPAQTVAEALLFSARLRLPASVPMEQAKAYVDEVMSIVDLEHVMFSLVGLPGGGGSGLSTEQRKRLTIAVEMVANPSVIFMDEPTTGLDARAAAIVMRAVRNVARAQRTVLVTIHQPSIEIFESFDNLFLLQLGGRTTYFGPVGQHSSALIDYLQNAVPGVEPIIPGFNPATWMLEVTGAAKSIKSKAVQADWPDAYAASELCAANAARARQLVQHAQAAGIPPIQVQGQYAAPFATQLRMLTEKFMQAYWRTPSYNAVRLAMTVAIALLYGSMYFDQGKLADPADIGNVQNIMGVIFSSTSFMGMSNMNSVQALLALERVVFYREQAASMYTPWAYGIVLAVVELPYIAVQSVLFTCIIYPMIHYIMTPGHFFFYLLMVVQTLLFFITWGTALVYATPSQGIAQLAGAGLNFLFNLFNGFVIPYPVIPIYYKWVNRIVPTTWVVYALAGDQLAGRTEGFRLPGYPQLDTVGKFMRVAFGYEYGWHYWTLLIVFSYIVFFRTMAITFMRYVSFLRR